MSSGLALEMQRAHGDGWKRYPAYKDSGVEWLGAVPEGWDVKRLKRMFRVINGSTPKSGISEYWDGDISWVTPDDLGRLKSEAINETARKITDLGYQSCGTTLAPAGSLVLSTRAPIGHLAIAEIDLCANQGCRSLIFKYGDNKRYFYYQLLAARPELESWGQGSTFRELGKGKLEAIELFSPPLPEQHAIAAFLDRETGRIDALIAKKERQIELLREKRTALISHAVTKGLDPDAPLKDSGVEWLGAVPEGWGVKRLKQVVSRIGSGKTPKGGAKVYSESGIVFLRSQNIHFGGMRLDDVVHIDESIDAEMASTRVLPNDILLNITGASLGRCTIVPEDFAPANVNQHVCIIRPTKAQIDPQFLHNTMASNVLQAQIFSCENGTSREGLTFSQISTFVLTVPKQLAEQRAIAAFLDRETGRIDALSTKVRESISKLREYRTALISAAVTGKIDVRGEET